MGPDRGGGAASDERLAEVESYVTGPPQRPIEAAGAGVFAGAAQGEPACAPEPVPGPVLVVGHRDGEGWKVLLMFGTDRRALAPAEARVLARGIEAMADICEQKTW